MLFHVSIEADHPAQVAGVIAELWDGRAMPFPPVGTGSWMAFANDDRATIIEVYPRGTELHEAAGAGDAYGVRNDASRRHGATHMAIATRLDEAGVLAIAKREGWSAKVCVRGGKFRVIEMWIEGCQMVEVLTDAMQAEYRDFVTVENWERMLSMGLARAA